MSADGIQAKKFTLFTGETDVKLLITSHFRVSLQNCVVIFTYITSLHPHRTEALDPVYTLEKTGAQRGNCLKLQENLVANFKFWHFRHTHISSHCRTTESSVLLVGKLTEEGFKNTAKKRFTCRRQRESNVR